MAVNVPQGTQVPMDRYMVIQKQKFASALAEAYEESALLQALYDEALDNISKLESYIAENMPEPVMAEQSDETDAPVAEPTRPKAAPAKKQP